MRTLLIGGAGFIGVHLTSILVQSGREVSVLGRRPIQDLSTEKQIQYIQGDFNDTLLLDQLIPSGGEVVQLAYATIPNTSFDDPLADLNQNLPPMLQLMRLCAKKDAKLILISSGGAIYGESISSPISEAHPMRPISPYGITKLAIENYAHLFSISHGLKYIIIRPSNPYGAGQLPFRGQGFIATALALILQGRPVSIFGRAGTVRDYIAIDDLTQGILAAMNYGHLGAAYNIGSGVGFSNLEVLKLLSIVLEPLGYPLAVKHELARPFDVEVNVLDSSKLQEVSGWKKNIDLADGLADLVRLQLKQGPS